MKKIKDWLKATGITNVAYLAGGFASLLIGWSFIAGACFGIFGYVNYNVISKIVDDRFIKDGD